MKNKILLTKQTSPEEITQIIFKLREQKGKEKEVLRIINEALSLGHQFIVSLFFEEALTNQHLYMNDMNNKSALIDMQNSILKAGFYIKKYNLDMWLSRYFRFLGRIEDYKKNFKKAIFYYNKSIKHVNLDPEPFRILELQGFLAYAKIQLGQVKKGFKLSKKVLDSFVTTPMAINLKENKFDTWIIWFSAVVINTYNALLDKQVNFELTTAKKWLEIVEAELYSKKGEFMYRKKELFDLKERLKL